MQRLATAAMSITVSIWPVTPSMVTPRTGDTTIMDKISTTYRVEYRDISGEVVQQAIRMGAHFLRSLNNIL
jgi:hypothetical protein